MPPPANWWEGNDWKVANNEPLPADHPAAQPGFFENLKSSAGNFAGNLINAATSPLETAGSIHDVVNGYIGKIRGQKPGDEQYNEREQAMASAMTKHFKDRYGSVEGIKKTAYEDPIGFAADLSSVIAPLAGGAGLAADAADVAGLARTASGLRTAAQVGKTAAEITNPLNVVKGVTKGASAVADALGAAPSTVAAIERPASTGAVNFAKSLYGKALNPSGATTRQIKQLAETGLSEGVGPADEAGVWDKIMGHAKTVQDMVDEGTRRGLTLDPGDVRTNVAAKLLADPSAGGVPGESFSVQATPSADEARVQAGLDDWTKQHFTPAQPGTPPTVSPIAGPKGQTIITSPGTPPVPEKPIPIPIGEGNAIKSGTYKQLSKKAFGKSAAGATEPVPVASEQTQLEIARDLRRQIGDELSTSSIDPTTGQLSSIGDVHGPNASEGKLLDLLPHVERNAANAAKAGLMTKATKGALINHALPRVAMGLYRAGKIDLPTLNYIVKQSAVSQNVEQQANAQ